MTIVTDVIPFRLTWKWDRRLASSWCVGRLSSTSPFVTRVTHVCRVLIT